MFWSTPPISQAAPHHSLHELRKRARILVIDDDPNAFPVKLLQDEGYNVTLWASVLNLTDLERGEFDLIVLDIHGITTAEQSSTGGLGILKHIKTYNPAQLVIAYSSKKYDFKQSEFWKLADDFLGKPSPLTDCKEKIDELLKSRFSAEHYWSVLKGILQKQQIDGSRIEKFEKLIVKRAKNRELLTGEDISKYLKISKEGALTILAIVGGIIKLWK